MISFRKSGKKGKQENCEIEACFPDRGVKPENRDRRRSPRRGGEKGAERRLEGACCVGVYIVHSEPSYLGFPDLRGPSPNVRFLHEFMGLEVVVPGGCRPCP